MIIIMLMICFTFGLEHQYPEGWGELQSELDWKLIKSTELINIYSKKISAYLDLNNITNSVKDVWPGYERRGFNGVFGLKYFF